MRKVILCFHQELYQQRLGDYLRKKHSDDFLIECQEVEAEPEMGGEQIVLTDDEALWEKGDKKWIFFLDFNETGKGITPYQSADEIASFLLWNWNGKKEIFKSKRTKLIIFYTPGGSSYQTRAAKQKAEQEAQQGNCLYIPVRELYYRNKMQEVAYDLSELCYQISEGNELTMEKIQASVEKGLDFGALRGFRDPMHLVKLTDEVGTVLRFICDECNFNSVVVDLQFLTPDYRDLIAMAEEVYGVEVIEKNVFDEDSQLYEGIAFFEQEGVIASGEYRIWKWQKEEV